MDVSTPHYLLFSEASRADGPGRWRFVLRATDGAEQFEAADIEHQVQGERLDLLTVVRGLEALDQPSRVTLVGCSPYVRQGMEYGLSEWRSNGWRWEFFGQMVPVTNGDLWQRLDRVLRFHRVDCGRRWRFDAAHGEAPPAGMDREETAGDETAGDEPGTELIGGLHCRVGRRRALICRGSAILGGPWRFGAALVRSWCRRLVQSCYTVVFCSRGG